MKRLFAMVVLLVVLLSATASASVLARVNQPIATRTGPGTYYTEPGTFLQAGDVVKVHSRVWDEVNEIWWVQVEFKDGYNVIRAYTGAWRMDVNLNAVPIEYPLQECTVMYPADAYAAPRFQGGLLWNDDILRSTVATLYQVDDGHGLIECWNDREGMLWRVWVDLDVLDCGQYYGGGSFFESEEYLNNFYRDKYSDIPERNAYPIGRQCTITTSSGHVRAGAGTQYATVAYVKEHQVYTILDKAPGNTGKDWYRIYVDGVYGWISSGLVQVY